MKNLSKRVFIALMCSVLAFATMAQDTVWYGDTYYIEEDAPGNVFEDYSEAEAAYLGEEQAPNAFDEDAHKKIADDINSAFEEPEPEEEEAAEEPEDDDDESDFDAPDFKMPEGLLKVLLIALVVAALGFLLYRTFAGTLFLTNTKVDEATYRLMAEMEEDLPNSDLDRYLQQALSDGNHKLAIRIYYLTIIQTLQDKGLIAWKKDKTNNAYLREMRNHDTYREFRATTRLFERVWYSNMRFGEQQYQKMAPRFQEYINELKK